MKNKWAWFGLGFVSGIVSLFILIVFIGSNTPKNDNLEVTEEKSKIGYIRDRSFDSAYNFSCPLVRFGTY